MSKLLDGCCAAHLHPVKMSSIWKDTSVLQIILDQRLTCIWIIRNKYFGLVRPCEVPDTNTCQNTYLVFGFNTCTIVQVL